MGNYFYHKKFECCNGHKLTKYKVWQGYNSYSGRGRQSIASCNQCSKEFHALLICETCNYKICRQCNPVNHEEICKQINWEIYKGSYTHTYCHYCGKSQQSLLTCKSCNINICFSCGKFKHSTLCLSNQFKFPEKETTRWFCNFCSKQQYSKMKSLMVCDMCQMKICNECRKTKNWK